MSEPSVLIAPVHTEKALNYIEKFNTIVYQVNRTATKHQVKMEFEKRFGVKVEKVRTVITAKGEKRAYIKLAPGFSSEEVATKLGLL